MKTNLTFKIFLLLSFMFIGGLAIAGDGDLSDKAKYKKAEQHVTYDNFDLALELYLDLFNADKQNFNLAYKIGYCYLSGEDGQDVNVSIEYLEMAAEKTNKRYKNSFKEKNAPTYTYYYLGVAYRLNKDFDKAISAFRTYQELSVKKELKSVRGGFIEREIKSCEDAREVMDSEHMKVEKIFVENLKEPNVRCPILCPDANRLIFTNGKYNIFPPDVNYDKDYSEGPFDGVYSADRTNDCKFINPQSIAKDLLIPFPYIPVTATADGSELYLIVDRYDNGDIYMSKYEDGKYQPAQKVKKLNTRKWESHATITPDGKRIYFASLRKGGEGGLDIWYSDRDDEGNWQKPVNLGPEINTEFHEEMPYVIQNGNALYFASEGHTNIGGFDMFYSNWDEAAKKWSKPTNLGYPFSTSGNDMGYIIENIPVFAFCPVNDNKRRDGIEECDCISLVEELAPQLASISGIIELDPEDKEALMSTRVKLIDKETGETIGDVAVDENGNYIFDGIESGDYDIVAYIGDEDLMTMNIQVPQNEDWDITGMDMKIPYTDQLSSISGNVKLDPIDNQALMNFRVKLVDKETGEILDDASLSSNGNYMFKGMEAGDYSVVAYMGDKDFITENVEVPESGDMNIEDVNILIPYSVTIPSDELMIENVFFDFDRYNIREEHVKNLEELSSWLVQNPNAKISITGHTDYYGDPQYNIELSKNRVLKTKWFLTGKGVKTGQIVVHFYGESNGITIPVEDDNIRSLNRRVVVEVIDQGEPPMTVKPIDVPEGFKVK